MYKRLFIFIIIYIGSNVFYLKAFEPTYISPFFYGPNALPVIDMHSGLNNNKLSIELSSSFYQGFYGDQSITPNLRIIVPLFTKWVNLEAYYSLVDIYNIPFSAIPHFQLSKDAKLRGATAGDIYVSTNIQILSTSMSKYIPNAVVRLGFKTASGGNSKAKRFTDTPGYFIDLTIARSIIWNNRWADFLSFSASFGFYCWQTGSNCQNDAYTYGIRSELYAKYLHFIAEWAGYNGWEKQGDHPMVIKAKIGIPFPKNIEPYIAYQVGVRDYPYHELKIGLCYSIPIIK